MMLSSLQKAKKSRRKSLQQAAPGGRVPTGRIAAALKVAPGTATAMVKTLRSSGLLRYEPYVGVRLTRAGARLAGAHQDFNLIDLLMESRARYSEGDHRLGARCRHD
ncbi:MAG: hypothetical protein AB1486_33895 [Planctomycetota bacterium]